MGYAQVSSSKSASESKLAAAPSEQPTYRHAEASAVFASGLRFAAVESVQPRTAGVVQSVRSLMVAEGSKSRNAESVQPGEAHQQLPSSTQAAGLWVVVGGGLWVLSSEWWVVGYHRGGVCAGKSLWGRWQLCDGVRERCEMRDLRCEI